MIAFCHACNMTALLCQRVSGWGDTSILSSVQHDCMILGGAMIAFGHACNMTAWLCHRVSGWGDDSILSRMQHDCMVVSKGFWVER